MTQGERTLNENPYAPPSQSGSPPKQSGTVWKVVLISGWAIALVANAGAVGMMLTLLSFEQGAAIRPMGHTFVAFLCAALGIFVAAPLCGLSLLFTPGWRDRIIAGIGVLMSVTPFPLASITLHAIAAIMGFTLKA